VSFLLTCPNCGTREVTDFGYGGEISPRPTARPSLRELGEYNYFRRNTAGVQREWWFHRSGCRAWFIAERDTRTNEVLLVELPGGESNGGESNGGESNGGETNGGETNGGGPGSAA
jgi:sarcosine oxidase, subunit delta